MGLICSDLLFEVNETAPPESWRDRQPTDTEVKAVTTLQAAVKGRLVRGIVSACKPGNLSKPPVKLT